MSRQDESGSALEAAIESALPDADAETREIITAVTGLLVAVAYADRTISANEAAHLKAELGRINGFSQNKVNAVAQVLEHHALRLSTAYTPRFTRSLRELLPEEMRKEILDALLGMAAADGSISYDEVTNLRNITQAMGLSQAHYNELQEKYRDKLG